MSSLFFTPWTTNESVAPALAIAAAEKLPPTTVGEQMWTGFLLTASIFLAAALLELTCLPTVKAILRQPGGKELYGTAWLYNVVNHLGIAPVIYMIGHQLFASDEQHSLLAIALYAAAVVAIHSVGYYCTHRAMHTKALYWAHRYHHRFNTHICPIAASATTQVEYLFAYVIPFIVAAGILRPIPMVSLNIGALIIGHVNNLIHTPWLEEASVKAVPWFAVCTHDHFDHHRKLTTSYAAPTINVDRLLELSPALDKAAARAFSWFGPAHKPCGVKKQ